MRLAVFDFDGTIYQGETLRVFLRVLGRMDEAKRRAVRRYFAVQAPAYLVYRLGVCRLRMMGRAMRGLVRIMAHMDQAELDEYFRRCLAEVKPGFRSAALARLRAHLAAGDRVVLLSGAFARFLALAAEDLGVRHWLGSDLPMRDGRCSGRMGVHSIGPAKVGALQSFLQEQEKAGTCFDLREAYAYADGFHDLPVLSLVGHPVAVSPDKGLAEVAQKQGWEVI